MFSLLKRIRNKRGDALMFLPLMLFLGLFFMALVVDFGSAYVQRSRLQSIADAATLGGASNGMYAYRSMVDGKDYAVIRKYKINGSGPESGPGAEETAKKILDANIALLPSGTKIDGQPKINPGGINEYFAGRFTVQLKAKVDSLLIKRLPTDTNGTVVEIPWMSVNKQATVEVRPQVVP